MLTGRATKGWINTAPQAPMVQLRCNNTRSPTGSTGILYKAGCFVLGMRGPPSDSLQAQVQRNVEPTVMCWIVTHAGSLYNDVANNAAGVCNL